MYRIERHIPLVTIITGNKNWGHFDEGGAYQRIRHCKHSCYSSKVILTRFSLSIAIDKRLWHKNSKHFCPTLRSPGSCWKYNPPGQGTDLRRKSTWEAGKGKAPQGRHQRDPQDNVWAAAHGATSLDQSRSEAPQGAPARASAGRPGVFEWIKGGV